MDTRSKIISCDAALEIARKLQQQGRELLVVRGPFDVLLAGHAADLQKVCDGTPGCALMVVLIPPSVPLLSERARAELVAALRMVDYVVTAGEGSVQEFLNRLPPHQAISRQAADTDQTRRLMEHVHRRHNL